MPPVPEPLPSVHHPAAAATAISQTPSDRPIARRACRDADRCAVGDEEVVAIAKAG
jgi:hypothetical protein